MTTPRTPADRLAALPSYINREWLDARHPLVYEFNRCPTCEEWSPCRVRTLFEFAQGVRVEDEGGHGDIDERSLAHRSVYGDQVHIAIAWPNGERWEGLGDDGPSLVGDVTRALASPAPPADPWQSIENDPAAVAAIEAGEADIAAGRVRPLAALASPAPTLDRERLAWALHKTRASNDSPEYDMAIAEQRAAAIADVYEADAGT